MKQRLVFKQPIFVNSSMYNILDILNVCIKISHRKSLFRILDFIENMPESILAAFKI